MPTKFIGCPRLVTSGESSRTQRVLMSDLSKGTAGLLLISNVAYFVYLCRTGQAITPKFVEFYVSILGVGTQAVEVGLFSSPLAPNKAAQVLTKLASDATVDSLTVGLGVKRNTSALTTSIAANTHLWAGIRTAMGTTNPTITGLYNDFAQGNILTTGTAGVLTGAGPWTGAIVAQALTENCPDLRVTLD